MKVKSETYNTTRELLLATPLPEQTRTYKPIPYRQVMDLTLEGIHKAGFSLEKEIYTSAKDGAVATGRYTIGNVGDTEMKLQINWMNSYDKSKRLTFAIGGVVLVCTNGMVGFRSLNAFKKKHQGEIQTFTPTMIPEYIKQAGEVFLGLQADREAMKEISVTQRLTAEILGRLFYEEQILESTQLNIVKRELEHPTHNYNSPGTLWELFNHVTFAIGGIHPASWLDDHVTAHRFFTNIADVIDTEYAEISFPATEDKRQLKLFPEVFA